MWSFGKGVGLPKLSSGLRLESRNASAERAARIVRIVRPPLFTGRHWNIEAVSDENRSARDFCRRMRIGALPPDQLAAFRLDRIDVTVNVPEENQPPVRVNHRRCPDSRQGFEGPIGAPAQRAQRIDGPVLASHEEMAGIDSGLRVNGGIIGKPKGPFKPEPRHFQAAESRGSGRLKPTIVRRRTPSVPRFVFLVPWCSRSAWVVS